MLNAIIYIHTSSLVTALLCFPCLLLIQPNITADAMAMAIIKMAVTTGTAISTTGGELSKGYIMQLKCFTQCVKNSLGIQSLQK